MTESEPREFWITRILNYESLAPLSRLGVIGEVDSMNMESSTRGDRENEENATADSNYEDSKGALWP